MKDFSAYKYVLRSTREINFIPIDIINLRRIRQVGMWFTKLDDPKLQQTLMAVIEAEYEKWKSSAPIIMILGTILTIFFTFIISFSIGIMDIGSRIVTSQVQSEIKKEFNGEVDKFMNMIMDQNIESFMNALFVILIILIVITILYYWKLSRINKVRNIIKLVNNEK